MTNKNSDDSTQNESSSEDAPESQVPDDESVVPDSTAESNDDPGRQNDDQSSDDVSEGDDPQLDELKSADEPADSAATEPSDQSASQDEDSDSQAEAESGGSGDAESPEPDDNSDQQSDETQPEDVKAGSNRKRVILAGAGIIGILAIVVAWAVLVGPLEILGSALSTHTPESTAEFVPDDAYIYGSINLRPGPRALTNAGKFLSKLRVSRDIDRSYEDLLEETEDIFDADTEGELFLALGPEISFAILPSPDFDDEFEYIFFVGFSDPELAEDIINAYTEYDSGDDNHVESDRLGGYDMIYDPWSGRMYVIVDDHNYVLISENEEVLEDAIDMMESPRNSLSEIESFQQVQAQLPSDRMIMVYLDIEQYFDFLQDSAFNSIDEELYSSLGNNTPEHIGAAVVLHSDQLELSVVSPTTDDTREFSGKSKDLAELMPSETVIWLGIAGLQEIWDVSEQALTDNRDIEDQWEDVLHEIDDEANIDLQRDLLENLGDGLSIGVFEFDSLDDLENVGFEGAIVIEVVDEKVALDLIEDATDYFEDQDLDVNDDEYKGIDIWWVEFDGVSGIEPGYAVFDNYLVITPTLFSLEQVIDVISVNEDSLKGNGAFKKATGNVSDGSAKLFVEVQPLMDLIIDSVDRSTRNEIKDNVLPWTEAVDSVLWSARFDNDWTINKVVITLAE